MTSPPRKFIAPSSPEARARWLFEVGGMPRDEIAWRLGLPLATVDSLLATPLPDPVSAPQSASDAVSGNAVSRLRQRLLLLYGLAQIDIAAPTPEAEREAALARVAAERFAELLRRAPSGSVIGLSHGRSISKMIDACAPMTLGALRFVSLLGELTCEESAYPHVAMHRLANLFSVTAHPMSVPLYAGSRAAMAQWDALPGVARARALALEAEIWIVGIGAPSRQNQLVTHGMVGEPDLVEAINEGADFELLGRFFDASGREIASPLSERTLAPSPQAFANRRMIAVAAGEAKLDAIRAALLSGHITELVTDTPTAIGLLPEEERAAYHETTTPEP